MTADQIRKAMGGELCALADTLRERFDAKLVFLETPDVKLGKDPSLGSVRTDGKLDEVTKQMAYWYRARQA